MALAGPCIPGLGRGQRGQDLPPQEQVWDHWVLRGCNFTHFTFDLSLTPLHLWMPTYICQYACNLRSNLQFTPTEIPRSRKLIGFMEFQTIWEGWVGQCLMNGVPGVCRSGQRASEGVFWAEIPCLSAVVGKNCGGGQEVGRLHWRGRGWDGSSSTQLKLSETMVSR